MLDSEISETLHINKQNHNLNLQSDTGFLYDKYLPMLASTASECDNNINSMTSNINSLTQPENN